MTRWRLALVLLLFFLVVLPLALPFAEFLREPDAGQVWSDRARLADLAWNTVLLVGGTMVLALPVGVAGAVLLYRSDVPLRGLLRFLVVLTLFVPLPLFASAWQAALGTGGLVPLALWTTPGVGDPDIGVGGIAWKPWAQGLGAAIWIHAVAALPWVVWLVGQGLTWVERELEEDALLVAHPWKVLWRVTLQRCRAAIFAAGMWVALQTATEITVTDMLQVRTYAEEVYNQFVFARPTLAGAVAVSLPVVVLTALVVGVAARRWERTLPPLEQVDEPLPLLELGAWRWFALAVMTLGAVVLVGVPLAGLIWKAGLAGSPETWSAAALWASVARVPQAHGGLLLISLGAAAAAGVVAAVLGLVSCWLALESRWLHAGLLVLMAVAWAMPGPIIGLGLKDTILKLLDAEELFAGSAGGPVRAALYDGPSPLPVIWATLVRFFPYALAVLWPVVRLVPRDLLDSARVDGASPLGELRWVVAPLCAAGCLRAALAVGVLSLGELGAGKLVETPGSQTFAHEVFNQMHYGVTNHLAGLCLVLLAMVVVGASAVSVLCVRSAPCKPSCR